MPHAPFIIASYVIAAVLLIWTALSPVIQSNKLKTKILERIKFQEEDHAS